MMSNKQGNKLRVFSTNNELEFVLMEFIEFYIVKYVKRHKTVVGTT